MRSLALPLLGIVITACGSTGQERISYPAVGLGAPVTTTTQGFTVTLDVARVGIGPVYFCATEAASLDLCPVAVNELAQVSAFDALDGTPQPLGSVEGVTGEIRSAAFNYAITWFPTQQAARPATAAPGGHSLHLEGRAVGAAAGFRFVADVDVTPPQAGTLAVQGQRVAFKLDRAPARLAITVDLPALLAAVDWADLVPAGPDAVPIAITAGSRAHDALVTALVAGAPARFTWTR